MMPGAVLTYLASPYSHPDPAVREWRAQAAVEAAAAMMATGEPVFCPIAHSHLIGKALGRATDHAFWMAQDLPVLRCCRRLVVLTLDGWETSRGVREEIDTALLEGIPVEYTRPRRACPPPPRTILEEAQGLVYGDRNKAYGHPRENFGHTVALLNAAFAHKLSEPFEPADFALMMILAKVARLKQSPNHHDTIVDIAGYAATYDRVRNDPPL